MFGEVIAGFKIAATKLTYDIKHGLAPYSIEVHIDKIRRPPLIKKKTGHKKIVNDRTCGNSVFINRG